MKPPTEGPAFLTSRPQKDKTQDEVDDLASSSQTGAILETGSLKGEKTMKTRKALTIAALCLALTTAGTVLAAPNGSTVLTFSVNPATLSGDSAADVTITTTTTSSVGQSYIDEGKVMIEVATDGLGHPVPAAEVVLWVALNDPGSSPTGGVFAFDVDLDALGCVPGTFVGFRAHYITGGGRTHVDTHFSAAVDLEIAETGTWVRETAWSAGSRYNPGDTGNWATYTPYEGEPTTVTLYAGQTLEAGTVHFSAPAGGEVTITITLNTGWRFFDDPENVKIQDYAVAPSGNPNPGQFDTKGQATGASFIISVPENNFYGVHVDVEWLDLGD
jgi:hypothetical protein